MSFRSGTAIVAVILHAAAAGLFAQAAAPLDTVASQPVPSEEPAATQPTSAPATQPAKPRFLDLFYDEPGYLAKCDCSNSETRLRYNEDYSFLEDDAEAKKKDWLLNLKNVKLGGRWRVDFGGEFRLRAENRTNPTFGLEHRTANTQQNYRWLAHANVHYGNLFRIYAEGIVAHVEDQDGPFQPTQENHGDIQQLFGDLRVLGEQTPLTLRLGRQELSYGHARILGAFEWISNRRRFDGAKLFYATEKWNIDAFFVRPVVVERHGGDDWNQDYNLYGVYNTWRPWTDHGLDVYFLGVDRADKALNPNNHEGGRSTYTTGARWWGKKPPWDYDTELAGQWGSWAGDSVQAWFWEFDAGYTFPHTMKPRIGAGVGLATGDDDPYNRNVGTWDQLFTYDHVCISFPDLVGRQNVKRTYLTAEFWPLPEKLRLLGLFHLYWLQEESDAFYNAGAIPVLRDPYGHHGDDLGREFDLLAEWKLTNHSSLTFGYSHFWNGDFVEGVVRGDDEPSLIFLQYQFKF